MKYPGYSFFDATLHVEFLYLCVRTTIENDLLRSRLQTSVSSRVVETAVYGVYNDSLTPMMFDLS